MKKYLLILILSTYMNAFSQTPTKIDSLGYQFIIDLPQGSEYHFSEVSYTEEQKEPTFETFLQIIIKLEERYIYVSIQKTSDFDKEEAKIGWLTDSLTKIADERENSLLIYTNENNNEEYHILYHKALSNGAYTFSVFYQSLTLPEAEKLMQILESTKE